MIELQILCSQNYNKQILKKKFTIPKLKKILSFIGEKKTGKKDILIDRLFNWIEINQQINLKIKDNKPILIDLIKFSKLGKTKLKKYDNLVGIFWTLQHYKLNSFGIEKVLKKRLLEFAKKMNNYKKFSLKKIKKIQNKWKQYYKKKTSIFTKYKISDCINQEDFLSFEDLSEIPEKYIFIYKDNVDNHIYGFDIRSIITLFNDSTKHYNPYNNRQFNKKVVKSMIEFYYYLKTKKTNIMIENEIIKDPYQYIREKAIKVFQIMNVELNNYADVNWFLNLNIHQLRKLYRNAEDIWNYRAQHLTEDIRKKHIPKNDAFQMPVYTFTKLININHMRRIILQEFFKFITEGESIDECKTGAMWMLTALVEVSPEACNAMPWLLQQ